ncbi:YfhO family protein [Rhodohalobacter sulfatireducens]|uniref:YfhO family protein n=1 Tax=Rhodohalobacter sulfatireducens TaxID=2911366 RepID=A0ABS9KB13_9BACT|nr:YfhO family protein [Rhodohalobacter sulfatireducens]MCG2588018.1 YfhO family protein [Rhodohalobacter sulfatireducens]
MANKKGKQAQKPDFWEQLSTNKQHLLALGFLFLLPFILHFSTTLGGQQYMGNDAIQWRAGAESLIEFRDSTDGVAHWATNMFSGMPANTLSHPPQVENLDTTLLRWLEFIYPAVEMWILLGGAYLMFILMGIQPLSALFGAIIIGFTTYIPIIIDAGHKAKFIAYIYIPWLYNGYFLITRTKWNRWLSVFLFALALTLHLRAYHPQITYYFLFPLGTLFIYDWVKAIRADNSKKYLQYTGMLLGAAGIAVLITFQMYWSTLEYTEFSMRGGSEAAGTEGLARNYAFSWSQGVGELLTLLIPGAFGGSEFYWGPKQFTSGPHYFGALAFLFFVIGWMKSDHRLKYIFLGPGIATLLFSLGENFGLLNNLMFDYFPLFDKFRVPETWLIATIFCFSAVSVFGFDWFIDQMKKHKASGNWKLPLMVSSGLAVIAILISLQALSYEKPGERQRLAQQIANQNNVAVDDPRVSQTVTRALETQLIPQRQELAQRDTFRFALIFILGIAVIWAIGSRKIPLSAGLISLIVILAFDLIRVDSRYQTERSLVDQSLEAEDVIERNKRPLDQFLIEEVTHENGWKYRVLPLLDNAFNNAIPAYFYPSAGGYSGAKLGYYQDLVDQAFFPGGSSVNTGILSMLNVRYLTLQQPINLPGFEVAYQGDDGVVIENLNVLPKAFFVDSVEVLDDQPAVLNRVSGQFDPSETAFITREPELNIQSDTTATVAVEEYSPNQITLNISRTTPGFLVLSEIWYPPGWSATLDGEQIDIIRTNYVLRGFEIPAGEHTLEMSLEPVWYKSGYWVTRFGSLLLFGVGAIGLFVFFKRKEPESAENQE